MMLADIFLATAILEVIGTVVETITVFTIFFSLWKYWTIEVKVLSPTSHLLFSCAQLWGARVFWLMSQQHRKAGDDALAEESEPKDAESDYQQEIILGKEESNGDQADSLADLENTEQMV